MQVEKRAANAARRARAASNSRDSLHAGMFTPEDDGSGDDFGDSDDDDEGYDDDNLTLLSKSEQHANDHVNEALRKCIQFSIVDGEGENAATSAGRRSSKVRSSATPGAVRRSSKVRSSATPGAVRSDNNLE